MDTELEKAARIAEANLLAMRSHAAAKLQMTATDIDKEFGNDAKLLVNVANRTSDVGAAISAAARRKGVHPAAIFAAQLAEHGAAHLGQMTDGETGTGIDKMNEVAAVLKDAACKIRGLFP